MPFTFTGAGGSDGLAGVFLSTVTVPVTTNSRPSRPSVSFGSDRYASGLPAQVFHGTEIDAVEPETVNACALAPFVCA